MNVFSKFNGFISRHRKKFVVGGIVISGAIFLTKYAQQKLKEWQEQEAKEFIDRTRRQQHFESTERTCNQTILSLMGALNESMSGTINTEQIVSDLRTNPEKKVELWERLKILVFTRASCLIYVTVMLSITLRIQLNIIGGHLFKDPLGIETEKQQEYLSLCNNLLGSGIKKISEVVEAEYSKIVGPMELKRKLSLKDLENIFWAIQTTVTTSDSNPIDTFSKYIVPDVPSNKTAYTDMITDTVDLLDSDEVKSLAIHCINRGFALLNDQLAEYYIPAEKIVEIPSNVHENDFVNPMDIDIPMAKLIPIINGLFAKKLPDSLIHQLLTNEKLKTLGANVYECFSN